MRRSRSFLPMNYAIFSVKTELHQDSFEKAIALLKTKVALAPILRMDDSSGEVILKDGCPIPFFRENDKVILFSVDIFGLHRSISPDSPWKKYVGDVACRDAYTYITALFKMCLCQVLNQALDDEGIGKYREDINSLKFASLAAWRNHHTRSTGWLPNLIRKATARATAKQDARFFPELTTVSDGRHAA